MNEQHADDYQGNGRLPDRTGTDAAVDSNPPEITQGPIAADSRRCRTGSVTDESKDLPESSRSLGSGNALVLSEVASGVQMSSTVRRSADDETDLDAENYDIVAAVTYRDTAAAKEFLAKQYIAAAQTDVENLTQDQARVGTEEQMVAIKMTGACPDAAFWWVASWLLVLVDILFWYLAGARALAF